MSMPLTYGYFYETDRIHPLERETTSEIRENPIFEWLAKNAADVKNRVSSYAKAIARDFPVTKETMPRLHSLYRTARRRLGCEQEYPLFLRYGYDLTAEVTGSDQEEYTIVLNSECLEALSDEELLALLGYQLGRISAGHIQTCELLSLLGSCGKTIPVVGELMNKQLWAFFARWMIASQYTADRSALFACGSLRAVEHLILKQMGATEEMLEQALSQRITKPEGDLGIYYVWLMQSMPVFGGVERIRELREWTSSAKFQEDYPLFYYHAAMDRGDASDADSSLMRLHQQAKAGDTEALERLADAYVTGKAGVARSVSAALYLYQEAANRGNAKSMHALATAMQLGMGGLKPAEQTINRLYCAAASRGFHQAAKKIAFAAEELPAKLRPTLDRYLLECKSMVDAIRVELPAGGAGYQAMAEVMNSFWMDADDVVYALDVRRVEAGVYEGLAVSKKGIFGRVSGEQRPFSVYWKAFCAENFYQKKMERADWLFCGNQPLYRVSGRLNQTIGELLIRLRSAAAK